MDEIKELTKKIEEDAKLIDMWKKSKYSELQTDQKIRLTELLSNAKRAKKLIKEAMKNK